jgi:hypothetical protein
MSSQRCSWRPRRHPLRISMESFSYGHATSLLRTILEPYSCTVHVLDLLLEYNSMALRCYATVDIFCAVSMSCAASRSSCTIVYWAMLNPRYTSASAFVHGLRSAALYNTRRLNKCHVSHRMQYLYACAAYRMHVRHVQHTICMALHSRALMRRPKMHGHTGSAVKSSARLENPDNTGNFATIATERFTAARKRCHHHHHGIRKTKICDTPRARAKNSRALI